MEQGDLFDICRNKHKGNAESEAANRRISPAKENDRRRVLDACGAPEGVTCRELAELWGVGMNQISGRFSELKQRALIEKIGTRGKCGVYRAV